MLGGDQGLFCAERVNYRGDEIAAVAADLQDPAYAQWSSDDHEANIRRAWREQGVEVDSLLSFLRYLLALDNVPDYADIVNRRFSAYLAAQPFTADQTRFLRAVQSEFLKKRRLHLADLYDPPLDRFGQGALERLFTPRQVEAVLELTQSLTVD